MFIHECTDLRVGPQLGTLRMLKNGPTSSLHLLFKQFATEPDEQTAASNSTKILIGIHSASIKVEPSTFVSAWWAEHKQVWWCPLELISHLFSHLCFGKIKACGQII